MLDAVVLSAYDVFNFCNIVSWALWGVERRFDKKISHVVSKINDMRRTGWESLERILFLTVYATAGHIFDSIDLVGICK